MEKLKFENYCPWIFRIVGVFPAEDTVEQMAFELAIHKVNLDPELSDNVKLEGRVEIVDVNDGYRTSKRGKMNSSKLYTSV